MHRWPVAADPHRALKLRCRGLSLQKDSADKVCRLTGKELERGTL